MRAPPVSAGSSVLACFTPRFTPSHPHTLTPSTMSPPHVARCTDVMVIWFTAGEATRPTRVAPDHRPSCGGLWAIAGTLPRFQTAVASTCRAEPRSWLKERPDPPQRTTGRNCHHRSQNSVRLAFRDYPRRHPFPFSDPNASSHAHRNESCNQSDKNLFHFSLPNWKDRVLTECG